MLINSFLKKPPRNAKEALQRLASAPAKELEIIQSSSTTREAVLKLIEPQDLFRSKLADNGIRQQLLNLSENKKLTREMDQNVSKLSSKITNKLSKMESNDSILSKLFRKSPRGYYWTLIISLVGFELILSLAASLAGGLAIEQRDLNMSYDGRSFVYQFTSFIGLSIFSLLFLVTVILVQRHIYTLFTEELNRPDYDPEFIKKALQQLPWLSEWSMGTDFNNPVMQGNPSKPSVESDDSTPVINIEDY